MNLNRDSRIAIVGAGPSGLFAARILKNMGFTQVDIFEKESQVAGYTRSKEVDGYWFDFSTKYIASSTFSYLGVYKPLVDLIKDSNVELIESADAVFYDPNQRKKVNIPPFLKKYGKPKILHDFLKAYSLIQDLDKLEGVPAIYKSGVARTEDTILSWGQYHNIPAFAEMVCFLSDIFSSGPSHQEPVGYLLKSRFFFLANYMKKVLGGNGTQKAVVSLISFLTQLRHLVKNQKNFETTQLRKFIWNEAPTSSNYIIKTGYKSFFEALVKRDQLSVYLSQDIDFVSYTQENNAPVLTFQDGSARSFDALILAVPPKAIAKLMRRQTDVANIFNQIDKPHTIQSWMFRGEGWPTDKIGPNGILLDASNPEALGTDQMVQAARPYAVSKEYADSNVMVTPIYKPLGMVQEDAEIQVRKGLKSMGIVMKEIIGIEEYVYPRSISTELVKAGWFEKVESLQKKNNTIYIGEVLSGQGVPSVLNYTQQVIPRLFG